MWKESIGSKVYRKDHKVKDATPISKPPPKTHWLGQNLVKKQKEFRKLFEFPEDEEIVASFNCSMRAGGMIENMVQGTLYITTKHVCFHSTFWGTERKEIISFDDVRAIEKKNTARIIPNALEISVGRDDEKETKYFFGTFLNRHEAYKVLQSHWERRKLYAQSLEVSQMTNALSQQELLGQARLAMSKVAERYEVTRPLGEGGFGKAFVVLDKQDFRQYVLKKMECASEEEAANAVKEMVLLRLMKHPYIVSYRDFWRDNLTVYIVMEYCEGGDMALLIEQQQQQQGQFPEQAVLRWLIQAVLAIEHMHAHNVLHRDIKPNNLFLNRWQDLKLGDFGLSAVARSGSKLLHAVGTLGYAAPEILRHKPYDSKSDIYALGCTLYEITTLRSVYDDQSQDLFPVPLPSEYSRDLERLMQAMLSKDPEKRPSASEVLAHPLLAPFMGKISIESEIYGEMQQREDENQQLLLKLRLLEAKLQGKGADGRDLAAISSDHDDGLYEDAYDPLLSLARSEPSPLQGDEDSDLETRDLPKMREGATLANGKSSSSSSSLSSATSSVVGGSRTGAAEEEEEQQVVPSLWTSSLAATCLRAGRRVGTGLLLPHLPLALTVAGIGLSGFFRLTYCWAPLWAALVLVFLPFVLFASHEEEQDGRVSVRAAPLSARASWLRLRRGASLMAVLLSPVEAMLLISALEADTLFSVALLVLFAACPGLSALARHESDVAPAMLNASVGAVFGLAARMAGMTGPMHLGLVGLVFGIVHLAARRWLASLFLTSQGRAGTLGVMSYVGVELIAGLAIVQAVAGWCLPGAPPPSAAGHGFVVGAVLCVGASVICALGCALPRRRQRGDLLLTPYCALATLASLLVAAKALAAGLLACP